MIKRGIAVSKPYLLLIVTGFQDIKGGNLSSSQKISPQNSFHRLLDLVHEVILEDKGKLRFGYALQFSVGNNSICFQNVERGALW